MHATLDLTVDPTGAGFDPARLDRIDDHLRTRYVDAGKIAGCQVLVARGGTLAHAATIGLADREREVPVRPDTIWRIFSMTKPVTGVALLTLYEQGKVALKDPVERYLPEFRGVKVRERDADGDVRLVDPRAADDGARPADAHVGHRLRPAGTPAWTSRRSATARRRPGCPAAATCRCWSSAWAPSRCASTRAPTGCTRGRPTSPPGSSRWCRGRGSTSTCRTTIFDPLGMADTGFSVPDASIDRFAALYRRDRAKRLVLSDDPLTSAYRTHPEFLSGGGGLVSTAADYLRFCRMLAGGGAVDGVRVLAPRTVELMRTNHLPGGGDLRASPCRAATARSASTAWASG